jgi:hypothetical protein
MATSAPSRRRVSNQHLRHCKRNARCCFGERVSIQAEGAADGRWGGRLEPVASGRATRTGVHLDRPGASELPKESDGRTWADAACLSAGGQPAAAGGGRPARGRGHGRGRGCGRGRGRGRLAREDRVGGRSAGLRAQAAGRQAQATLLPRAASARRSTLFRHAATVTSATLCC